jgi:hypothetical protein
MGDTRLQSQGHLVGRDRPGLLPILFASATISVAAATEGCSPAAGHTPAGEVPNHPDLLPRAIVSGVERVLRASEWPDGKRATLPIGMLSAGAGEPKPP